MDRLEKKVAVENIRGLFQKNQFIVILQYGALKFSDITRLRHELRDAGGSMKFVKNTLAKIASDVIDVSVWKGVSGSVCLICGDNPVEIAKVIGEFKKSVGVLSVLSGMFSGQVCDIATIEKFAKLPTLDVARSMIAATLKAPMSQICRVLSASARDIVSIIDQKNK